jgi:hypothetical protein
MVVKGLSTWERDAGIIETSTFSMPRLLILICSIFCFATAHPHHPAFLFPEGSGYLNFNSAI